MTSKTELIIARQSMRHGLIMNRAKKRYTDYIQLKTSIAALVKSNGDSQMFRDNLLFNRQRAILSVMSEEVNEISYHYGLLQFRIYRGGYVSLSF